MNWVDEAWDYYSHIPVPDYALRLAHRARGHGKRRALEVLRQRAQQAPLSSTLARPVPTLVPSQVRWSCPSPTAVTDPLGIRLVQAILDRKARKHGT